MKASFFLSALLATSMAFNASARDQIRIVGSSTVYPFVSAAAEQFGKGGKFKTPIVESTGTGGGIKLFCEGADDKTPDIANASRPIKDSEIAQCKAAGVSSPLEVKIGYDGIVLANSKKSRHLTVSKQQLFLALAKQVPQEGKLVANPYKTWAQIDPKLPDTKIEVYGPPPTSGTRDSLVELLMEKACEGFPEYSKAWPDKEQHKKMCGLMREDGAFVEAGENDNIIVQKLTSNPAAFGIFGYSFLEENKAAVQSAVIDSVEPTFDSITSGKYAMARSLYVYAKNEHIGKVPGIKEFLRELVSEKALGDEGYLVNKGLIPLPKEERAKMEKLVNN